MVEHQDLGPRADRRDVTKRAALAGDAATVHADPEAVGAAGLTGDTVVVVPQGKPTLIAPLDPASKSRIIPV
jgi:hypothetical protein